MAAAIEGHLRREVLVVVVGDAGRCGPAHPIPEGEVDFLALAVWLGRVVVDPGQHLLAVVPHGEVRLGQREDAVDDLGFAGRLRAHQFSAQARCGPVGREGGVILRDVGP